MNNKTNVEEASPDKTLWDERPTIWTPADLGLWKFPPGDPYTILFWRPYLGGAAFGLWQTLVSCQELVKKRMDGRWPSVEIVAAIIGVGDRYTLLGRAATRTRPAQAGLLGWLVDERLLRYWTHGDGTARRYGFDVRDALPLLTPAQVKTYPEDDRRKLNRLHREWLEEAGVSLAAWKAISEPTLIPPFGLMG